MADMPWKWVGFEGNIGESQRPSERASKQANKQVVRQAMTTTPPGRAKSIYLLSPTQSSTGKGGEKIGIRAEQTPTTKKKKKNGTHRAEPQAKLLLLHSSAQLDTNS